MPQNQVDSGACGRHVPPADGVGSLKHGPRTHPAHADGRLGYNGADRDGQNGNPDLEGLSLQAGEIVFIDDLLPNIDAARRLGMHVIHFDSYDYDVRPELDALLGSPEL